MENSSYPTENRRDYDDRQTNQEEGGNEQRVLRPRRNYSSEDGSPRRNYNSEDGGSRRPYNQGSYGQRGPHRPYSSEGSHRPYNSEGSHRPYNSEDGGSHRPYNSEDGGSRRSYNQNGYGKPRNSYGSGPHRPYNSEGSHRPYNPEGQHRPYNSEEGGYGHSEGYGQRAGGSRRPYNSEGSHRPYNSEEGGSRKPYNQNGYGKPRNGYSSGPRRNGFNSGPHRGYKAEEGQAPYGRPRNDRFAGQKGGFKPRKSSGPKPESGIDRMLSRKPLVDDKKFSDNDMVSIPIKEEVRLNKFIADSGICSRREADNFIVAGVVTVNGVVVTELGSKVNKFNDDVRFNGERLKGEAKVYIVMNKPKGYVTTTNDPHAEKTVMDLMKSCTARVTPVGRLDKNTTGVLMFTNDGEIAEKLTHPSYNKKKIYEVTLTSDLSQEDYDKILAGLPLSDGVVAADELEYVDDNNHKKLGIEIHSGKNRIVRRIFESLGYTVKSLDRVYFAGLTKKGIKRGAWRYLSEAEVNILKMGAYN